MSEIPWSVSSKRLLALSSVEGLSEEKLRRLHAIAGAAVEGRLERERLLALDPDQAVDELLELPGIGPFWSQAILLRAVGPTDAITLSEPRLRAAAAERYQEPQVASDDEASPSPSVWRPFRTWVGVLLRPQLRNRAT